MNKSNELSANLEAIKVKASELFNQMVVNGKTYDFVEEVTEDETLNYRESIHELTENCELDMLPTLEFRSKSSGNHYYGHVCKVTEEFIEIVEMEDEVIKRVGYNDLTSLEDQLILLNEMENLLV